MALQAKRSNKLLAIRSLLNISLEKSRGVAYALDKTGPRLEEIKLRLPYLEAAVRPIRAHRGNALAEVGGHIDRAVGPAAAVLKVFDAVHGLEKSLLSDPHPGSDDLASYLSLVTRLEDAVRFLDDNCGLAIQWLEDIIEYLEDNAIADHGYLSKLRTSIKYLGEFQSPLDCGLLNTALDNLEADFLGLLKENTMPLPMSASLVNEQPCIAPSPLPVPVIHTLQAITVRLTANNRLEKCISIYVGVRGANGRESLQALNLDYLEISVSEFSHVQSIEAYIDQWGKHLEFAVKHLIEAEYNLCNNVFEKIGADVRMDCFAKLAAQAGILSFLRFGKTVTETRKDPNKLLKLLDIFASLNKLRLDFNRLFGGKACLDIRNLTRDLIKRVIEGACEIFYEFLGQVEMQRQASPPHDASVPRLVRVITDYCNRLLGDDYRPILAQVLVIQSTWKHQKHQERLLTDSILAIIKATKLNVETWSKAYDDTNQSYIFVMNNHWHFYKYLKCTKLGDLLGDATLKEHEQLREYYTSLYLRENWGMLPRLLSREGLVVFSGGRATARDLVKKRLKAFNEAFDEMYRQHSNWVVPEKDLRDKICQMIVQAIIPAYRSYMQNYGPLVEQDPSASKYAKYTAQSLEKKVMALFRAKPRKHGSSTP